MSKQLLEVGQTVWVEVTPRFTMGKKRLIEMYVISANKTSAYLWTEKEPTTRTRYKVNQRNKNVKYPIPTGDQYRLWLTKEEYEAHKIETAEKQALTKLALEKLEGMNLDELRQFVS